MVGLKATQREVPNFGVKAGLERVVDVFVEPKCHGLDPN